MITSDVRCGLRSQIDNICAVVIPTSNSVAFAHAVLCSGALACWLVSASVDAWSMICAHAQRHMHAATITARFWTIGPRERNANKCTSLFELTPDAVPIRWATTAIRSTLARTFLIGQRREIGTHLLRCRCVAEIGGLQRRIVRQCFRCVVAHGQDRSHGLAVQAHARPL